MIGKKKTAPNRSRSINPAALSKNILDPLFERIIADEYFRPIKNLS